MNPAKAYWNQRHLLSKNRNLILSLCHAVDSSVNLSPFQWAQLMAFAQEFKPDVILELGRGAGNSTCAFTQSANWMNNCRVISLDIGKDWEKKTVPKLRNIVPESWFNPLQIYRTDILAFDYKSALLDCSKILIFWDAHGYEIAECVLGGILPLIQDRPHLVVMHDLSDARYCSPANNNYGANRLWKGNNMSGQRLRIGHIDSAVEQAVAITDFISRNNIELHSADHDFHKEFSCETTRASELQQALGDELFSLNAHWFWFTLNESPGFFTFPQFHPPKTNFGTRIKAVKNLLITAVKILLGRYPVARIIH